MTELHDIARTLGIKYKESVKMEVHRLLSTGIDPEAKDDNGMTAVDIARTRNAGWYFEKMICSYAIELRREEERLAKKERARRRQYPLLSVYERDLHVIWERLMEGIYLASDLHHVQDIQKWAAKWHIWPEIDFGNHYNILDYVLHGNLPLGVYSHQKMEMILMKYEMEEAQPRRKAIKKAVLRQARRSESRFHALPKEVVKHILSFAFASHLDRYQSIRRLTLRHRVND